MMRRPKPLLSLTVIQLEMLMLLKRQKMRNSEIAEALGINQTTTYMGLQRLEDKGFATSTWVMGGQARGDNGRQYRLYTITAAGLKGLEQLKDDLNVL